MKKNFTVLCYILFFASIGYSQFKPLNVQASLNNVLRYGSGLENRGGQDFGKEYFENIADGRLKVNDFVIGFRLEISDPIEYGLNFKGLRKRYMEYNNTTEGISVRAGDFWDLVGRGLSLNSFENRSQAYDTGIDGIRITYKKTIGNKNPVKVKAQILGGDIDYNDFLNFSRKEIYKVRDANFEISPVKFLTLGTNYVFANGSIMSTDLKTITNLKADIPEGYINFNLADLQIFTSYAHKHVATEPNKLYPVSLTPKGDALYTSLSYSKPKYGLTIDYKNYRFDLTAPDNQATDRPTRMLPFQNPPTALKEHSSTLISRNPHVVNFNDEVGGQLDFVYAPSEKLTFNFNAGIASKHYEYKNTDTTGRVVYGRVERSGSFFPSLNDALSPFWEFYLEGEYYATKSFYAKVAYARQGNVIYNQINSLLSEKQFYTTIPTEFKYSITKEYTLKLNLEQQFGHNSIRRDNKDFMNTMIALTLSKTPDMSCTISGEFTDDNEDPTGKKFWALGEASYKITPTNTVTASFGTERGGLRCTSGICRYVNPFNGFRLTVNSIF